MTLLTSILQRQLVPSPVRRALPVDFALEAFACIKDDEHLVERREIDVPPFACRFNKTALGGHMLAIADEDGWVQILDSRKTGKRSIIKEWNAHENAVFDIAWMEGEQMLVTASGDQTIRMWDVNRDQCLAVFKGHSCSVKSVDFREDEIFVFATGARDGNVMVWDMRCNRRSGHFYQPINVISNAHLERLPGTRQMSKKKPRRSTSRPVMNSSQQSVTAVLFQGGKKLISAGAVDGKIKIWDLRKTYTNLKNDPVPFHIFPYPGQGVRKHGFSSLVLDSTHSRLFAGCTNDQIYMYNCTSLGQEPLGTFSGHLNSTFYVKSALSPNDMYLLSGSSDNNAYIWKVSNPTAPPIVLKGHLGEVTSVAWCPSDQGKVVTCSDDNSFRIWRINHQACKNDRLNLIGESCKLALQTSVSPVNDKISASRFQDRTPSSSPSTSPDAKRLLWTPPSKLITNPRLNQISSPVGMATRLNSPINRTPPQKQNLLTQSPKATMSPPNLKTGLRAHAMHDAKITTSTSFVSSSRSQPSSPECISSQVSSPKSPAVIKYQSPKQLLASWLRTNSRKRSHSDSVDTTDDTNNSVKSELTLSDKIEKNLGDKEKTFVSHNLVQEHGNKENNISGQKCLATSPLRKRRCSSDPLNSTTHNSREINVKPNSSPGKENHVVDQGSTESSKQEESGVPLGKTCNKPVTVKVKNQVSVGERQKNWLTEWSDHCRAKNRGKTIELSVQGGESKDSSETMNLANEEKRDNLQATTAQVAEVPKPGRSILTYFKHDFAS